MVNIIFSYIVVFDRNSVKFHAIKFKKSTIQRICFSYVIIGYKNNRNRCFLLNKTLEQGCCTLLSANLVDKLLIQQKNKMTQVTKNNN